MELPASGHDPVLLAEVLSVLNPQIGQTIIDCTLGRGGHASHLAPLLGSTGLYIGIDADPANLEFARSRLSDVPCICRSFHASFAELPEVLEATGIKHVDAIFADLGISTNQLFDERYGLSFSQPMPLDMRIDSRLEETAADLVNKMDEENLANVLYELAQERYSRRIARKIVEARRSSPITTTDRLAELVRAAIPSRGGAPDRIDPATPDFYGPADAGQPGTGEPRDASERRAAGTQARREICGHQFPFDGRPPGEAKFSVSGADRAMQGTDQEAPLPRRRRNPSQPAIAIRQAPRR